MEKINIPLCSAKQPTCYFSNPSDSVDPLVSVILDYSLRSLLGSIGISWLALVSQQHPLLHPATLPTVLALQYLSLVVVLYCFFHICVCIIYTHRCIYTYILIYPPYTYSYIYIYHIHICSYTHTLTHTYIYWWI